MTTHESIEFDVLFVGGGPANLAGAIRLMQLANENGQELEVAIIDKGAAIGSHAISGAVMNPMAIAELYPDYRELGFPIEQTVRGDGFFFLTANRGYKMPIVPRQMHNQGFPIVSLSKVCRWLGEQAEEMGINVFPGFDGKSILLADDGATVTGVRTGDKGLDKDGKPKPNFEPGIDLLAKVTVLGEGARGSLMKELAAKLPIRADRLPEVFETGVKEVIQLPDDHYFSNRDFNDVHTMGFPLDLNTPGGGFVYEMAENRIALGFLVALGYEDPAFDLYETFMRFKRHPMIQEIIRGGKVVEQGARAVSTGGWFSMPHLAVDGALFTGNAAAMHSTPAIKGIHLAMKSGMLAAETIMEALVAGGDADRQALAPYTQRLEASWAGVELLEGRNFAQALAKKGPLKWFHLAAQYLTKGRGVIDRLPAVDDATTLNPLPAAPQAKPPATEAANTDDPAMVDKLTGVYLSGTLHREDQPSHVIIHDQKVCVEKCYSNYGCPCTRFCPGDVYEMETIAEGDGISGIKLNFSNCLHCKTCDIKDPFHNVTWTCPEGGEGPNYKRA